MTTTPATKRMRFAALGLTTALSVGALAPFVGLEGASAVTCSTATSSYSTASTKLATDQSKLTKAKKKLKKDKKHHKRHAVIKHDKKKVKKLKHKVAADKSVRNNYASQVRTCTTDTSTPGGTATTANPLAALLGTLTGSGTSLSPQALVDALNTLADQLQAAGAPSQLSDGIKSLATAIGSGAGSLSPTQFQSAVTAALAQLQSELTTPPTTPQGLIDDIINPLVTGLTAAGVPVLPNLLQTLQIALDTALGALPSGLPNVPIS